MALVPPGRRPRPRRDVSWRWCRGRAHWRGGGRTMKMPMRRCPDPGAVSRRGGDECYSPRPETYLLAILPRTTNRANLHPT